MVTVLGNQTGDVVLATLLLDFVIFVDGLSAAAFGSALGILDLWQLGLANKLLDGRPPLSIPTGDKRLLKVDNHLAIDFVAHVERQTVVVHVLNSGDVEEHAAAREECVSQRVAVIGIP